MQSRKRHAPFRLGAARDERGVGRRDVAKPRLNEGAVCATFEMLLLALECILAGRPRADSLTGEGGGTVKQSGVGRRDAFTLCDR